MKSGDLDRHISQSVRPALQRRHGLLLEAVRHHLGEFVEFQASNMQGKAIFGGYFLWLTLKGDLNAKEVAQRAMEDENLVVASGNMFQVKGDEAAATFDQNIRLCFAWEDEENILEGVKRLARVLRGWNEPRNSEASEKGGTLDAFK
jgi:DNA-binding transcriptional MocR family regulator